MEMQISLSLHRVVTTLRNIPFGTCRRTGDGFNRSVASRERPNDGTSDDETECPRGPQGITTNV